MGWSSMFLELRWLVTSLKSFLDFPRHKTNQWCAIVNQCVQFWPYGFSWMTF
jgi:hypothetical protein